MTLQIENNNICHGCLSENRTVSAINTYFHIYEIIMTDTIESSNNMNVPLMCWECKAILRNVVKFKQKALEAHKYLTGMNKYCQKKSLSNLSTTHNYRISKALYMDDKETIQIKIESLNENTDIKQEIVSNAKNNNNAESKHEIITEINYCIKEELIEDSEDVIAFDIDHESGENVDKKKYRDEKKCKIIYLTQKADRCMYTRIKINEQERLHWTYIDLNTRKYRLSNNKCELCIIGFNTKDQYLRHITRRHNEMRGAYTCDICKVTLPQKSKMYCHIKEHYSKYVCDVCRYQCYHDHQMRRHLVCAHKRTVECLKCRRRFEHRNDFHAHFKELHTKFTCDYCGLNLKKKERLVRHISGRHGEHKCKECDKTYKRRHALVRHTNLHHVRSATELCYCVECNIQFDNVTLFTEHVKYSVKHRARAEYHCPECKKVYHRRIVMMNHYNHVHVKKTKYYCEMCRRFFLNGYRLRQHNESTHIKVSKVKDKMCPYCGRGFSTNRILQNHIRIHTGEKPFTCDHCTAKFRQRQALVTHTRAIHKIHDFK